MASQFQFSFFRARRSLSTLDVYLLVVTLAGLGVFAFVARDAAIAIGRADLTFWLLAACVLPAELVRFTTRRRGTVYEITMSRPFVLAFLTGWGAPAAMVLFIVASVITDLVHRKPAARVPFNAAQYVLSIGTAGAVYTSLGGTESITLRQVPAFVAAALVLMLVNRVLVRVAVGLYEQRPLTLGNLFAEAHVELLEGAVQCGVVLVAMLVAGHRPVLPLILALPALPIFVAARATDRAEMLAARNNGLGGEEQADLQQRRGVVLRTVELQLARLAADLHDGPVQRFRGLVQQLQTVQASIEAGSPEATKQLHEVEERVTAESANLRLLVDELRPPVMQRLGLAGALTHLATQFETTGGIDCTVRACALEGLSEELEVMLYRVAQEALTNVVKHADAAHVRVTLARDDGAVRLQIHDDGSGFDPESVPEEGHYGLALRRRWVDLAGGVFQVNSMPGGGGTTITVQIRPD